VERFERASSSLPKVTKVRMVPADSKYSIPYSPENADTAE
jgi:hypothetical protein